MSRCRRVCAVRAALPPPLHAFGDRCPTHLATPHVRVPPPCARQVQKVGENDLPCISLALQGRGGLMGGGGGRRCVVQALVGTGTPITMVTPELAGMLEAAVVRRVGPRHN